MAASGDSGFTVRIELGPMAKTLAATAGDTIYRSMAYGAIDAAGPFLQRKLITNTPSGATGALKQAAYFERSGDHGFVGYQGAASLYAPMVETGRRPGRPPPSDALAYWAMRQLGVSAGEARTVGYLIARKIGRVGTKGQFPVKKTVDGGRRQAEGLMRDAAMAALRRSLGTG